MWKARTIALLLASGAVAARGEEGATFIRGGAEDNFLVGPSIAIETGSYAGMAAEVVLAQPKTTVPPRFDGRHFKRHTEQEVITIGSNTCAFYDGDIGKFLFLSMLSFFL